MFKNYFKPTPVKLLKISTGLKALIGSISGATYLQGNPIAAFWLLVAGAVVDFLIQCVGEQENNNTGGGKAAVWLLIATGGILALSGCRVVKPETVTSTATSDSSWTNYKTVNVDVKGASVRDSLANAATLKQALEAFKAASAAAGSSGAQVPQSVIDSLLNHFKSAFKGGKDTTVVTDPQSKVQLKYWYDAYGNLQMQCSSKDETIQLLVAENNRLHKEVTEAKTTEVVYKMPWYGFAALGWAAVVTLILIVAIIVAVKNR